ncbi:hypothetical protein LJB42_004335 [Komagataella kurtzmanii]|nr:hypothetical protein LJB42_004335 [Komagataella kurtzmanii]
MSSDKDRKPSLPAQLSDEQKKINHIQSEQRRREQIRSTYDKLVDIVPDLTTKENRSELSILTKTSSYIRKLREENEGLLDETKKQGIDPETVINEINFKYDEKNATAKREEMK